MLMSCGISEVKYVTQVSSDTFRSVISCSSSGKLDVTEKLRVLHTQRKQTKELICNGVKSSAVARPASSMPAYWRPKPRVSE